MKCLSIRSFRYVLPVFAALVLLAASAFGQGDAASVYKAKCAACHGEDGKGTTAAGVKLGAHDFASPDVQKQTDAQLIDIVPNGKNKMPAYKGKIPDDQIKGLIAYIRALTKK
jgi:mono/diheme cytochrome c family protein